MHSDILILYEQMLDDYITIKGDLLCPVLHYGIYISGVLIMCQWSFSLKYPTDHLLYNLENVYFEWKQEHGCFRACLFKCKWADAPRPLFQDRTMPLQLVDFHDMSPLTKNLGALVVPQQFFGMTEGL